MQHVILFNISSAFVLLVVVHGVGMPFGVDDIGIRMETGGAIKNITPSGSIGCSVCVYVRNGFVKCSLARLEGIELEVT